MNRLYTSRICSLLLLPFLVLFGSGPEGWHCADGSPCETATALACCCGCTETGGRVVHECRGAGAQLLPGEDCGCYYYPPTLTALSKTRSGGLAAVPALPAERLPVRPSHFTPDVHAVAPACHGPPGCVLSPGIIRGPPTA